jgi:hypothetical protein
MSVTTGFLPVLLTHLVVLGAVVVTMGRLLLNPPLAVMIAVILYNSQAQEYLELIRVKQRAPLYHLNKSQLLTTTTHKES